MSFETNFEYKQSYVYVYCQGEMEITAATGVFEKAMHLALDNGYKKVLIDFCDLTGQLTTLDRYQLGISVSELQEKIDTNIKVAVVGKAPLVEPERFGETVALNRGVLGRVFEDLGEAVLWLEKPRKN